MPLRKPAPLICPQPKSSSSGGNCRTEGEGKLRPSTKRDRRRLERHTEATVPVGKPLILACEPDPVIVEHVGARVRKQIHNCWARANHNSRTFCRLRNSRKTLCKRELLEACADPAVRIAGSHLLNKNCTKLPSQLRHSARRLDNCWPLSELLIQQQPKKKHIH